MTITDVGNLFMFAGGLGMFLYGMHSMSGGIQKTAGNKMKELLGILTSNHFMAVVVGALVTAIIQSSGATTVMVVGFVNCGHHDTDTGRWRHYGSKHWYLYYGVDRITWTAGRCFQGIFPFSVCTTSGRDRSLSDHVQQKGEKADGR